MTMQEYHDIVSRAWLWFYRVIEGGFDWEQAGRDLTESAKPYESNPFAVAVFTAMLDEAHRIDRGGNHDRGT